MFRAGRQHRNFSKKWEDRSAKRRRRTGADRQAAGGPRAGAGPAWRLYGAGVAAARATGRAISPGGSAVGVAAKGAPPPRQSTQCQTLPDGSPGAGWFGSADGCTPSAEHTWCKSASAGLAAKAGVMTAAASDSVHQANTRAVYARALRRWWNRRGCRTYGLYGRLLSYPDDAAHLFVGNALADLDPRAVTRDHGRRSANASG